MSKILVGLVTYSSVLETNEISIQYCISKTNVIKIIITGLASAFADRFLRKYLRQRK